MENYYKLFFFSILISQILIGCAEPYAGSGGTTSGNYSSDYNDESNNGESSENTSKELQAISQDINVFFNEFVIK